MPSPATPVYGTSAAAAATAPDAPLSAAEYQFVSLVNDYRASVGLNTLVPDRRLSDIARERSRESMAAGGTLTHYDANGQLVIVRLLSANYVRYALAGENLAENNYPWDQSMAVAHAALLASPEHLYNVVHPAFTEIGIGIAGPTPQGRFYYTQVFLEP